MADSIGQDPVGFDLSSFEVKARPKRFEGVIERQGQLVRWIRQQTCFCVAGKSRPDPQCPRCKGRGNVDNLQTSFEVESEQVRRTGNCIEFFNKPVTKIRKLYLANGTDLPLDEFRLINQGQRAMDLRECGLDALPPSEVVFADYDFTIEKEFELDAVMVGAGTLRVKLPDYRRGVPYEISRATQVTCNDQPVTVTGIAGQFVFVLISSSTQNSSGVWRVKGAYIPPFTFAITAVTNKMIWEEAYVAEQGELVATVPYNYLIGPGDRVTLLTPGMRGSQVFSYSPDVTRYSLPKYDVERVVEIVDETGARFEEGVDWNLVTRSDFEFISAKRPSGPFSVMFLSRPTFAVLADRPNVRTFENRKFPKRVSLQLADMVNDRDRNVQKTQFGPGYLPGGAKTK